MKPFPEDPKFTPGEKGFDDKDDNGQPYDLLGRKTVGQRLTDLLDRVEQPLVVALDGGWGSGKSHFLKLWTGAHTKELGGKAKVIYFDAFEHDYLDDPLISLVARLTTNDAEQTWGKTAIKAVKRAAMPLAKLGLRISAAAATAGLTEVVGPVADAAVNKVGEATQASVDAFWKREANRISAMKEFRDALTALTLPAKVGEPPQKIVFIIDELDRCRPDYALTLLEIVKHFFAVPNVHFVLGTNMIALENSVRARYGVGIQATEYLMKFIRVRMNFPEQRNDPMSDHWAKYFDFYLEKIGLYYEVTEVLKLVLSIFSQGRDVSIRDVQSIASRLILFPSSFVQIDNRQKRLVLSALVLQVLAPSAYTDLRGGRLTIQRIQELFPEARRQRSLIDESVRLHDLWREALVYDPNYKSADPNSRMFDFTSEDRRRHHFERLWSDYFDSFQIPEK